MTNEFEKQNTDDQNHGEVHEYDGIIEHDNKLPLWWLATLWLCTIFGVGYWAYYHSFAIGLNQEQLLEQEIKADQEKQKQQNQGFNPNDLLAMSKNPEEVALGANVFATNCVACHGAKGEGIIGPNLTDSAWIHGDKPEEILHSVANGWIEKGMMAWEPSLGPKRVRAVTAYLLSIKDTNVPGKAPEGPRDATKPAEVPAEPTPTAEPVKAEPVKAEPAQPTAEDKALDSRLLALSKNAKAVKAGKEVYTQSCVACHGANAEGVIGPNLTDSSWLHGGQAYQIHTVVSKGWTGTAMVAWEPVLGKDKVDQVVAYLLTIKNTNKPGKAAEGTEEK